MSRDAAEPVEFCSSVTVLFPVIMAALTLLLEGDGFNGTVVAGNCGTGTEMDFVGWVMVFVVEVSPCWGKDLRLFKLSRCRCSLCRFSILLLLLLLLLDLFVWDTCIGAEI